MFILMGEAEKISPLKTGTFFCPICENDNAYTHHHSISYFTLFGIKVAKLDILSDYLSCNECVNCFSPQIISSPQQYNKSINQQVMLRVLCYLLSGYGDTIQSRERLLTIFKTMNDQEITFSDIDKELVVLTSSNTEILPFLNSKNLLLSSLKKQQLVIAAYKFTEGSCVMEHHDRVRVNTIGSSLGLSLPEIEYLIVNNQ